MSIAIDHLTKKFGNQTVVNGISFTTERKGVVGFLGPNGAGKSTTMEMITGYLTPDEGSIKVCGVDVSTDRLGTKKMIGYLPEGNPLYYDMYVREYLSFIASVQKTVEPKRRIEEVIRMTGLKPESNKKTGQLSKGYKQRVGLAAAILNDPEVLILDEPTNGLDPNQIVEIRELIRHLGESKVILFSSHILQEVESICSRIIIINKGNIVADDKIENLKTNMAPATVVSVRFNPDPPGGWFHKLEGIIRSEKVNEMYHFETSDPDKLKKRLLAFSLENDLNIVSLDSQNDSLENIFKNLTKQNNQKE